MILDSNSDHVWIFGSVIGHLGAEIGFWSFHRNWWKYARPPIILTSAYILACPAGTSSRYSTGGTPPTKAEHLNESSSASPGGSQQLEILPSPNSKRAANVFQIRWYFTRRGDFNARQDSIVRLYFCQMPTFCKSAYISGKRQYFGNPPIFWKSANILEICQHFGNPPTFWKSANILEIRQHFGNPPTFWKSANIFQIRLLFCKAPTFCGFAWFLLLQIFVYIFSIYLCI